MAVVEGPHEFLAVRMKAYPHDTACIARRDFDPRKHEIARDHKATRAQVRFQVPRDRYALMAEVEEGNDVAG